MRAIKFLLPALLFLLCISSNLHAITMQVDNGYGKKLELYLSVYIIKSEKIYQKVIIKRKMIIKNSSSSQSFMLPNPLIRQHYSYDGYDYLFVIHKISDGRLSQEDIIGRTQFVTNAEVTLLISINKNLNVNTGLKTTIYE